MSNFSSCNFVIIICLRLLGGGVDLALDPAGILPSPRAQTPYLLPPPVGNSWLRPCRRVRISASLSSRLLGSIERRRAAGINWEA